LAKQLSLCLDLFEKRVDSFSLSIVQQALQVEDIAPDVFRPWTRQDITQQIHGFDDGAHSDKVVVRTELNSLGKQGDKGPNTRRNKVRGANSQRTQTETEQVPELSETLSRVVKFVDFGPRIFCVETHRRWAHSREETWRNRWDNDTSFDLFRGTNLTPPFAFVSTFFRNWRHFVGLDIALQ